MVRNRIHSRAELFTIGNQRKKEGECDLAEFIMNRKDSYLDELISKSWYLENAATDLIDD